MKRLFAIFFLLVGCAHPDAKYWPNPYEFPPRFFVEQTLSIRSLRETKTLRAQVERKGDTIQVALTDPASSMVLIKLNLVKDKEPDFLYQAPILEKMDIRALKIASAIQYLYESKKIPLRSSEYQVRGPSARFTYTWDQLRGDEPCQFPEEIRLVFADERYDVTIDLLELDCKV